MYLCMLIHTHVVIVMKLCTLIHFATRTQMSYTSHTFIFTTHFHTIYSAFPDVLYPTHSYLQLHSQTLSLTHLPNMSAFIHSHIHTHKHSHMFILKLTCTCILTHLNMAYTHTCTKLHTQTFARSHAHHMRCAQLSSHSEASKDLSSCGLLKSACSRLWVKVLTRRWETASRNRFGHCQALCSPHLPTVFPHCPPRGPWEKSWAEICSSWEQLQLSQIQPRARHVVW